ncbi:hypothetical protein [Staphylococcus sp. 17KM0847]|uniref:hypothetical protein n=1 Tax=Staphylococcus sp. 17KM0847 TaxID=2583989 RepID=UPI0015DD4473|nr:hypothetical protein [Staphylococcus sp. 17KM0847]QLK86793.1 hypothetical protein FGL66_08850 [Staphylococcus sp. 17KM0847]
MKKITEKLYLLFERLGHRIMTCFFIVGAVVAILFISMATIIPELNRHVYEGEIIEKYHENHTFTTGTVRYIVVKNQETTITIENSDILLHGKLNSKAIHKDLREGQHVKVYTIGFDSPSWGMYPNLYRIELKR